MVELGTHLTKKTNDELKQHFISTHNRAPTAIGETFGIALHETFFATMNAWCDFIDTVFEGGVTACRQDNGRAGGMGETTSTWKDRSAASIEKTMAYSRNLPAGPPIRVSSPNT